MTLEIAKQILDIIDKTKLTLLKHELLNYAVEYSRIRVEYYIASDSGRIQIEDLRSAKHNAFIDSCNILSREMLKIGEDASWRKVLGNDRRTIGDFACYIHLILGLRVG